MTQNELIEFRTETFDECFKIAIQVYLGKMIREDDGPSSLPTKGETSSFWPKVGKLGNVLRLFVEDPYLRPKPIYGDRGLIRTRLEALRSAVEIMRATGGERPLEEFVAVAQRIMTELSALREDAYEYLQSPMAHSERLISALDTRTTDIHALAGTLTNWREYWAQNGENISGQSPVDYESMLFDKDSTKTAKAGADASLLQGEDFTLTSVEAITGLHNFLEDDEVNAPTLSVLVKSGGSMVPASTATYEQHQAHMAQKSAQPKLTSQPTAGTADLAVTDEVSDFGLTGSLLDTLDELDRIAEETESEENQAEPEPVTREVQAPVAFDAEEELDVAAAANFGLNGFDTSETDPVQPGELVQKTVESLGKPAAGLDFEPVDIVSPVSLDQVYNPATQAKTIIEDRPAQKSVAAVPMRQRLRFQGFLPPESKADVKADNEAGEEAEKEADSVSEAPSVA